MIPTMIISCGPSEPKNANSVWCMADPLTQHGCGDSGAVVFLGVLVAPFDPFLELCDTGSQRAHDRWKTVPKQQQRDHRDNQDLPVIEKQGNNSDHDLGLLRGRSSRIANQHLNSRESAGERRESDASTAANIRGSLRQARVARTESDVHPVCPPETAGRRSGTPFILAPLRSMSTHSDGCAPEAAAFRSTGCRGQHPPKGGRPNRRSEERRV